MAARNEVHTAIARIDVLERYPKMKGFKIQGVATIGLIPVPRRLAIIERGFVDRMIVDILSRASQEY